MREQKRNTLSRCISHIKRFSLRLRRNHEYYTTLTIFWFYCFSDVASIIHAGDKKRNKPWPYRGPAGPSVRASRAHTVKRNIMFLRRSVESWSRQCHVYRNRLLKAPTGEIDFHHNSAPHPSNADIHDVSLQAACLRWVCNLVNLNVFSLREWKFSHLTPHISQAYAITLLCVCMCWGLGWVRLSS